MLANNVALREKFTIKVYTRQMYIGDLNYVELMKLKRTAF